MQLQRRSYFQTAWVVVDLDAAIAAWAETALVGPFFVQRDVQVDGLLYRGRPAEMRFSTALAQTGAQQVELIEQHDDAPSAYRDSVPAGTSGMHHVCAFTEDLAADFAGFAAKGIAVAQEGSAGGMRFAYFDTREQIGCMTELFERETGRVERFERIAAAGRDWDGRNPIREI